MTSPFATRGVIEGFYGNPWTHDQRLECVRFIGARGMNTFVYGPKDDPLVRRRWREAYADEALARLGELVAAGKDAGVEIVYAISPGLSIRYSSEREIAALLAKLEQVGSLGIRRFALLLDDLPPELAHDEDRAVFADIAAAHASLACAVVAGLGPERALIVCPLVYHGRGDEPYVARLAAALDPAVDIFWTGREICSPTLEVADAVRFAATAGRPPLYWDNYPVNDVAMGWELHIGPYRGRDADLHEVSRGILANPMELFEASKIPLATIADYLNDPAGYDAEASIARAIRDLAGEADADAFAAFAENVRSSCLRDEDAPTVTAALASFAAAADEAAETGDRARLDREAAALRRVADTNLAAADRLLRGPVANPGLMAECRPWIEAFEVGSRAMHRAAALAADRFLPNDEAAVRRELLPFLAEIRRRRVRVFGDALDMFLSDITNTHVKPGTVLPAKEGGLQ
ncbi:MAG TPA: protein O-GlcNAcase [Candidatus Limnocylindrales bacterium]|nr:protein O-GlcNAcase [Candidatus Limnocylindrales bacterium]